MLSFELRKHKVEGPDELEIYLDDKGLESLMAQLNFLREAKTDHVHLMSDAWGGGDLNDRPVFPENSMVQHVKISKI